MSFAPRPLCAAPAFDGMELAPALTELWGLVPPDATLERLRAEASARSYYRIRSVGRTPESAVIMRLPEGSAATAAGEQTAELPFVSMQRYLTKLGIPVPVIYVDDTPRKLLLLEDLGDETFGARFAQSGIVARSEQYAQAVDLLAALHERAEADRDCIAYTRGFDAKLLRWELEHFREWGILAIDIELSAAESSVLDRSFDALVAELLALPQVFAHRDYQSRNLMWAPRGALVVIDFQDALLGPLGYDLAALLCDSYVDLDEPLQLSLVERYAQQRRLDVAALIRAFRLVSVQRKLKDAGRFVFIDQVRGDAGFLPWYGASVAYAARALAHLPAYAELASLLGHKLRGYPDAVKSPGPRTGIRAEALK